ncbi:T9SS type A sorting domain-containing protein [Hoylesella buccalis]|nr:T9SS type A sorting domain-containing protein [Hoylesella buccalis]
MNMRKFHLLFYLALLPVVSSAQGRIGYSYDASGNRVKREIVMPIPKAMAKQQNFSSDNQSFSDMLRDHSIKIYPNPTKGALRICVSGLKGTDKCSLDVYTTQGVQILAKKIETDNIDINISNQPNGVYLLQITINGKSTTWKIVKK